LEAVSGRFRYYEAVGRKPIGFQARSVALPQVLWERIERFRSEMRLSNTAEAVRVLLWRVLDEIEREKDEPPEEEPDT
jgi:Arc/MetJ-type ribon-helix-helix transcriptional regulator